MNALSQRGTNVDLNTPLAGLDQKQQATICGQFVNLVHLDLQRDHDFDAMKLAVKTPYTTGGLALAATVKRPYALHYQATGAVNQVIRGRPIWPANEQDVIRIGLEHGHHSGLPAPGVGGSFWRGWYLPGGRSALDMDPGGTVWWM